MVKVKADLVEAAVNECKKVSTTLWWKLKFKKEKTNSQKSIVSTTLWWKLKPYAVCVYAADDLFQPPYGES